MGSGTTGSEQMDELIGRINAAGTVDVVHAEDDQPVTFLECLGAHSFNEDGVVISLEMAADIGLQIEGE